ncbi:MAG: nucleotidyltransferase domain-containing protein [Deltaproteobacteria bacterium]|nr:nucleotidyltransferase domain-containing protein [Deltaproteobacteria bacterium]MCL5792230.1 nucleotidyltransferase domain-containing protein [Deltaproteobacteria bacterium]
MRKKLPQDIKIILHEVQKILKKVYGENLKKIILYGSYARGDFTNGSDIDLMILLKDMKDPMNEREKYFNEIWELDLKYDTLISIIPLKEEEYKTRKLPVILNAKHEGVVL